jgi:hypothetical protein
MPLFQLSWFVCFQPQLLAKAARSNSIPSAISAPGTDTDMLLYITSRHVSVGGISQIPLSFALASRGHPLAWNKMGSRRKEMERWFPSYISGCTVLKLGLEEAAMVV